MDRGIQPPSPPFLFNPIPVWHSISIRNFAHPLAQLCTQDSQKLRHPPPFNWVPPCYPSPIFIQNLIFHPFLLIFGELISLNKRGEFFYHVTTVILIKRESEGSNMKNESNLNPLTASIPHHVETSLLICTAL